MLYRKQSSFLLLIWSFTLALNLIHALDLNSAQGFQVLSEPKPAGSSSQYIIVNAGDINNDGFEDIIIGDMSYDGGKGIAYVIYGTPQASPPSGFDFSNGATLDYMTTGFTIKGAVAGDLLGCSVSSAGDVNNDGFADIIVGANGQNSGQGAAYVIYGGKKSDLKDIDFLTTILDPRTTGFMITGNAGSDFLGSSVSSAGDFNKDGYDDMIIGAISKTISQGGLNLGSAGAVYVVYGGPKASSSDIVLSTTDLDPATTGFMIKGEAPFGYLGMSVSSAGDIDGDGYADIAIASPYKGKVYVIYGAKKSNSLEFNNLSTQLIPASTGFIIKGDSGFNFFGNSISAAGDVNGDGHGDIVIGAPFQNAQQGVAYVIYGKKRAVLGNIDLAEEASGRMMMKYQGNHDSSRVLTSRSLLSASQGFAIVGEASPMQLLGGKVSGAGDVNGDGYDDIIVGATGGSSAKGKVYVLYGGKNLAGLDLGTVNLPQAEIGYSVEASEIGTTFGSWVGSAMDVADNKKVKLFVSENLQNGQQFASYIFFPSELCVGEHCEFCNLPGTCSICSGGYWLANEAPGIPCKKCPERCTECTSDNACQACEAGYSLSSPNSLCTKSEIVQFYGSSRENVTNNIFDGTSIIGAALSSGSSLPINFGLVAKILRNVKYLDVTVSTELQEAFISWRVNSGFLAAPKSWALKAESKPLPGVFSRYGLASTFLVNYWKPFLMTLIGLALFAVFKGIEIVVYKGDKEMLKSSIPRQLNLAASNFALTQIYSNLDDVILYFILDVRSTKVDGAFGAFSLILAVGMLLIGGMVIGAHIFLLRKYQGLKAGGTLPPKAPFKTDSPPTQIQRFFYKYENMKLIFNDFKDVTFFTQSFLWIHLTRALFSSFLFAILFEYPLAQLILLLILNLIMIVFLLVKKSFKDFLGTFSQLFCEFILLIANICMLGLAILDQNESYNLQAMSNLSRAVIVLNAILLFGSAILMIIGVIKSIYTSYMAKKKATHQGLKAVPRLQNNRLTNSEKFVETSMDKTQLGTLPRGNHSENIVEYQTQNYLNHSHIESRNNQIEVFDLNTNQMVMNQGYNAKGNYEPQLESNNASFSGYQAHDDIMNTSNMNLLSNNNNNSFMRVELLPQRPRRRAQNIKMPGGFQTNPKSNFGNPVIMNQFQSSILQYQNNNNSRLHIVNNDHGREFSPDQRR